MRNFGALLPVVAVVAACALGAAGELSLSGPDPANAALDGDREQVTAPVGRNFDTHALVVCHAGNDRAKTRRCGSRAMTLHPPSSLRRFKQPATVRGVTQKLGGPMLVSRHGGCEAHVMPAALLVAPRAASRSAALDAIALDATGAERRAQTEPSVTWFGADAPSSPSQVTVSRLIDDKEQPARLVTTVTVGSAIDLVDDHWKVADCPPDEAQRVARGLADRDVAQTLASAWVS